MQARMTYTSLCPCFRLHAYAQFPFLSTATPRNGAEKGLMALSSLLRLGRTNADYIQVSLKNLAYGFHLFTVSIDDGNLRVKTRQREQDEDPETGLTLTKH